MVKLPLSRWLTKTAFRSIPVLSVLIWLSSQSCIALNPMWSAFNDAGVKFIEDKEYDKAEKVLLDAVKEVDRTPSEKASLITSLRLLCKVYEALGNAAQLAQIESRLRALGESGSETRTSTTVDPAKLTEDPSSDPTLKRELEGASASEGSDPQGKGMARIKGDGGSGGAPREREFTISTSATNRPGDTSQGVEETSQSTAPNSPPQVAFNPGISEIMGGGKKAHELMRLVGHVGWTKTIDITSDGSKAISGSQDNSIRYWNLKTGKEISRFEGHDDDVNAVVFNATGDNALSAGSDCTVRLWDLSLGTELKKFVGHQNLVTCVAFSPAGNLVASGGYDGTVRLWDSNTGKIIRVLEGNLGTVRSVAFSPDGEQVASGGTDKAVTLWSVRDGKPVRKFVGHKSEITSIEVSRDGSKILSASRDLTVQLWDLLSGEPLKLLQGHENWVQRACFLGDDRAISAALDKTIRVWDLNAGKEIEQYKLQPFGMWSIAFTRNGGTCLTGSDDFSIRVWSLP